MGGIRYKSGQMTHYVLDGTMMLTILAMVSFGMAVGKHIDLVDAQTEASHLQARHPRVTREADRILDLDLRVSKTSPNFTCAMKVKSLREPKYCRKDRRFENVQEDIYGQVYYTCQGKNYSFEELLKLHSEDNNRIPGCSARRYDTIDCCLLAYMGNKMNHCLNPEGLKCYVNRRSGGPRKLTPQCKPPKTTTRLACNCYHSLIPVCGEEELPKCNDGGMFTECRHRVKLADGKHSCICHKATGKELRQTRCKKQAAKLAKDISGLSRL